MLPSTTTSPHRLLRLKEILAPGGPLPISPSTWWKGVKDGRYPAPVKLGPGITVWRYSDIEQLAESGVDRSPKDSKTDEIKN